MVITNEDKKRIEEAIAAAEKTTSGEIVPMIVRSSSVRGHLDLFVSIVFVFIAWSAIMFLLEPNMRWSQSSMTELNVAIVVILTLLALIVVVLIRRMTRSFDWLLRWTMPGNELDGLCHARAELEFYRAGLNKTDGSTGILLFVSTAERRAVVLADKGIASKLPKEIWNDVVETLLAGIKSGRAADGFIEAIGKCGRILTEHFPIQPGDKNELPNTLIVKD